MLLPFVGLIDLTDLAVTALLLIASLLQQQQADCFLGQVLPFLIPLVIVSLPQLPPALLPQLVPA